MSAKVLFGNIDKTIPFETQETIPAGPSTKTISLDVPSVPFNADAKVCVSAYSDKAQTKAISTNFCKNVSLTSGWNPWELAKYKIFLSNIATANLNPQLPKERKFVNENS